MKKTLITLLVLLLFGTSCSASAFSSTQTLEVYIENYEGLIDVEDIRVDFLVKPHYDYGLELREEYKDVDNAYMYKLGDYYSVTAYIIGYETSMWSKGNQFGLTDYGYNDDYFYLVIYDDEGNIYHHEIHRFSEAGDSQDGKVYRWFVYDFENDELRIESNRVLSVGEVFFLISGGGIVIFAGFILLGYIPQKRILRKYLKDEYRKYRKYLVFISLGYYGMYVITWWFLLETERIIAYLIMFGMAVFSIRKVNKDFQHKRLTLKKIIKIEIIPLVCFVIFWIVTDLVLQISAEDAYNDIVYPVIEWIFG